jgi:hypothetical protein
MDGGERMYLGIPMASCAVTPAVAPGDGTQLTVGSVGRA